MKRTKVINKDRFRKSVIAAGVVVAALSLSGCGQEDENVKMYMNSDECAKDSGNTLEQCKAAEAQARAEAEKTAPRFNSYADCYAEYGDMCQQRGSSGQSGSSTTVINTGGTSSGGGEWMPLMMGYMMGHMMANSGGYGGGYNNNSSRSVTNNYYNSAPMYRDRKGTWKDNTSKSYNVKPGQSFKVSESAMKPKTQAPRGAWEGSKSSFSNSSPTTMKRSSSSSFFSSSKPSSSSSFSSRSSSRSSFSSSTRGGFGGGSSRSGSFGG